MIPLQGFPAPRRSELEKGRNKIAQPVTQTNINHGGKGGESAQKRPECREVRLTGQIFPSFAPKAQCVRVMALEPGFSPFSPDSELGKKTHTVGQRNPRIRKFGEYLSRPVTRGRRSPAFFALRAGCQVGQVFGAYPYVCWYRSLVVLLSLRSSLVPPMRKIRSS